VLLTVGFHKYMEKPGMTAILSRKRYAKQLEKFPTRKLEVEEKRQHFLMYDAPELASSR